MICTLLIGGFFGAMLCIKILHLMARKNTMIFTDLIGILGNNFIIKYYIYKNIYFYTNFMYLCKFTNSLILIFKVVL